MSEEDYVRELERLIESLESRLAKAVGALRKISQFEFCMKPTADYFIRTATEALKDLEGA